MTRYLLIPVIPKKMFLFSTHYDPPFSKVTHFKLIIIFIKLNYVDEYPCVFVWLRDSFIWWKIFVFNLQRYWSFSKSPCLFTWKTRFLIFFWRTLLYVQNFFRTLTLILTSWDMRVCQSTFSDQCLKGYVSLIHWFIC